MNRLLWSVYRLEEAAPNDLLDAIEASFVVQWHEQYITAAITLALLGDMADRDPPEFFGSCQRPLKGIRPWRRRS